MTPSFESFESFERSYDSSDVTESCAAAERVNFKPRAVTGLSGRAAMAWTAWAVFMTPMADAGRRAGPPCGGVSAKPSIRSAATSDSDRAGEETLLPKPCVSRVGEGPPPAMETPQSRSSSLRRSAAARRSSRLARLYSESLRF